jgi:hypothetical protein
MLCHNQHLRPPRRRDTTAAARRHAPTNSNARSPLLQRAHMPRARTQDEGLEALHGALEIRARIAHDQQLPRGVVLRRCV